MYAAEIDGIELTLEASGKLWQDALVMADDQTGSLWSQISGECISGKYLGKKLTMLPSTFSTFGKSRNNPNTEFLAKPEKGQGRSRYKKYFEDRGRMGIFGTVYNDSLMEGKDLIIGLRNDDIQVAVLQNWFKEQEAILVPFAGDRVLLISDGHWAVSGYFLKTVDGRDPRLKIEGNKIIVSGFSQKDTPIIFDNGKYLKGPKPEEFPLTTAYWFAWKTFFPATEVFQP